MDKDREKFLSSLAEKDAFLNLSLINVLHEAALNALWMRHTKDEFLKVAEEVYDRMGKSFMKCASDFFAVLEKQETKEEPPKVTP